MPGRAGRAEPVDDGVPRSHDCSGLAPSTVQSQGCTGTTEIENAATVTGSCAALSTATSLDGGTVVLDAAALATPCAPGDASAFAPTFHPPRAKQSGACTSDLIAQFVKCIDDSATSSTPQSCAPFDKATGQAATCLACLQSKASDPQWGPLVDLPNETLLNVPGCLSLVEGDTTGAGCGGSLQADEECTRAACVGSCPLGSSDPTTATQEVQQQSACEALANADGGACTSYAVPASCAGLIVEGDAGTPAEAQCLGLPSQSTDAILTGVATAFCGP